MKRASMRKYLSGLDKRWASGSVRAKCGLPQCLKWPAEAFKKNLQVWYFLQLVTENVSASISPRRYGPPLNAGFSKWPLNQIVGPPLA